MEKFSEIIGKGIVILLGIIVSSVVSGFVFAKLWLWFIVSVFNLPVLNIGQAIGIMFFIGYLKLKKQDKKEDEKSFWEKFIDETGWLLLVNIIILFFGYLLKSVIY